MKDSTKNLIGGLRHWHRAKNTTGSPLYRRYAADDHVTGRKKWGEALYRQTFIQVGTIIKMWPGFLMPPKGLPRAKLIPYRDS
jgi:hypothetical protein